MWLKEINNPTLGISYVLSVEVLFSGNHSTALNLFNPIN